MNSQASAPERQAPGSGMGLGMGFLIGSLRRFRHAHLGAQPASPREPPEQAEGCVPKGEAGLQHLTGQMC